MKLSTYAPVAMSAIFIIFFLLVAIVAFAFSSHRHTSSSNQIQLENKSVNEGTATQSDALNPKNIPQYFPQKKPSALSKTESGRP
jgi:hypothetical protein